MACSNKAIYILDNAKVLKPAESTRANIFYIYTYKLSYVILYNILYNKYIPYTSVHTRSLLNYS